ncbi:PEP-CTERM sorting domain-containing protein [Undibacterium sp. Ren11W]|uniref:PEP-CTERM sorting domain-containing protein n=1 Tax=Undibacterium sp. Ren11W TaxID=3413045 RepID=UPI003BF2CDB1
MKLKSLFTSALLALSAISASFPAMAEIKLETSVGGHYIQATGHFDAVRNGTDFYHADTLLASTDGAAFNLGTLSFNLWKTWEGYNYAYATGYFNGVQVFKQTLDFTQVVPDGYNHYKDIAINPSAVNLVIFNADGFSDGAKLSIVNFTPAVPEPETYAMLLVGLGLIASVASKRKQQG